MLKAGLFWFFLIKNQPFLTPRICLPNIRRKFASISFFFLGKITSEKEETQPQEKNYY